jgi:hypothetical protein
MDAAADSQEALLEYAANDKLHGNCVLSTPEVIGKGA